MQATLWTFFGSSISFNVRSTLASVVSHGLGGGSWWPGPQAKGQSFAEEQRLPPPPGTSPRLNWLLVPSPGMATRRGLESQPYSMDSSLAFPGVRLYKALQSAQACVGCEKNSRRIEVPMRVHLDRAWASRPVTSKGGCYTAVRLPGCSGLAGVSRGTPGKGHRLTYIDFNRFNCLVAVFQTAV